ncbi:MAG TPA: hydroxysqualene dehydroxylase HpnE, partial [Gammaproteobacteria bacterium]
MSKTAPVIIAGAGWAGMAAALELAQNGIPVTVLESAPQAGGRARTVSVGDTPLDNGQHLLIGAYHETLRLLAQMGLDEEQVLLRQPLHLEVIEQKTRLCLHAPKLPAPLHLAWGLLSAAGVSATDKRRALRMSLSLAWRGYRLERDISVEALLEHYRQGPELIRRFWQPLCLATLNTPLQQASAEVFLRVLKDSFSHARKDADLLLPRVPLGELFCDNAWQALATNSGNRLELGCRVSGISAEHGRLSLQTGSGEQMAAEDIVIATSPTAASRLLAPMAQTTELASTIGALGSQPITTVYLHYPDAPPLSVPMLGLAGTLSQWLFDRRFCNQPGWYAVVISAEGEHNRWDKGKLAQQIQQELADNLPQWPAAAQQQVVIREKRATFACRVGCEALRPDNATALDGLWLAGDYTATGY